MVSAQTQLADRNSSLGCVSSTALLYRCETLLAGTKTADMKHYLVRVGSTRIYATQGGESSYAGSSNGFGDVCPPGLCRSRKDQEPMERKSAYNSASVTVANTVADRRKFFKSLYNLLTLVYY